MRCACLAILIVATGSAAAAAETPRETLADRFRELDATIQAHHVEAPTRQQMLHAGIVAMYHAAEKAPPAGLGTRISTLTTHEQLAALLAEVRPQPGGSATTEAALDQAFVDGLAASVPGGLTVMEAKESKVAAQLAGNRYVGIQISVTLDEKSKRPKIMGVLEGGPAARAGMQVGDLIDSIDGQAVGGLTLAEYIDRLRGEEGTPVTVGVRRGQEKEPRTFLMVREAMRHATISGPGEKSAFRFGEAEPAPSAARPGGFRLAGTEPIGYLKIQSILASTPREVREAAARMEAEGLKALVIDLRQTIRGPGSAGTHPTVLLADELLDSGTIGRVRLASREETFRAEPGALFNDWPIAVLVDRTTADLAEWLAAALKANQRATIVGTTTAGLGTSRSTVPVGETGRMATLVTGLLEWPDGRPLGYFMPANPLFLGMGDGMELPPTRNARLGVTPDVPVGPARRTGPATASDDPALKAAVDVVTKALRQQKAAGPERNGKVAAATEGNTP